MRLTKRFAVGLLATILAGVLLTTVRIEAAPVTDDSPMVVTVGRMGDRVTYAHFINNNSFLARLEAAIEVTTGGDGSPQVSFGEFATPRPGEAPKWVFDYAQAFGVSGLEESMDRTGRTREALVVKSNRTDPLHQVREPSEKNTEFDYVDLESRLAIRTLYQSEFQAGSRDSKFVYSHYYPQNSQLPGLRHQGQTIRLGQDLEADLPFALVWHEVVEDFGRENVTIRYWVADRGLVGGHDAYEVRLEVMHIITEADWVEAEAQEIENLPYGPGNRFVWSTSLWFGNGSAYPLLVHDRGHVETAEGSLVIDERQASLVQFSGGTEGPIPWKVGPGSLPPPTNVLAERSPEGNRFPADGSGLHLPYPLSQALSDVRGDAKLTNFQAWRQAHADAELVSASLSRGERSREGFETLMWRLTFASPPGEGFTVSTERVVGGISAPVAPPPVTEERGSVRVPAFQASNLPRRPITLAAAEGLWSAARSADQPNRLPNVVHWGFQLNETSGTACLTISASLREQSVADFDLLEIGYSSEGSCVESRQGFDTSRLLLQVESGLLLSNWEWRVDFSYAGPIGLESLQPLEPAAATSIATTLGPPSIERASIVAGSLLVVFLAFYFAPLIKYATTLAVFPGYARLRKAELLNNQVRDELLAYIKQDPGVHAMELARRVRAGWGTVVYHLNVLEKNKLVSSLIDGRHKRFFPVGGIAWNQRGRVAALKHEKSHLIYQMIADEPGIVQGAIANRAGMSVPAAIWHLQRLEGAGLVGRDKKGRKVHYYANEPEAVPEPYDPGAAVEVV